MRRFALPLGACARAARSSARTNGRASAAAPPSGGGRRCFIGAPRSQGRARICTINSRRSPPGVRELGLDATADRSARRASRAGRARTAGTGGRSSSARPGCPRSSRASSGSVTYGAEVPVPRRSTSVRSPEASIALAVLLLAPAADRIEVLEPEPDAIDVAVAARAHRVRRVHREPLARGRVRIDRRAQPPANGGGGGRSSHRRLRRISSPRRIGEV